MASNITEDHAQVDITDENNRALALPPPSVILCAQFRSDIEDARKPKPENCAHFAGSLARVSALCARRPRSPMSMCPASEDVQWEVWDTLYALSICFFTAGIFVCAIIPFFWMPSIVGCSVISTVIFITTKTHRNLALCYQHLERLEEAVAQYCKTMTHCALVRDTTAIRIGECPKEFGRHEEAFVACFSEACACATATLDFGALWTVDYGALHSAFFKLANAYYLMGEYERAAEVYKQVQALSKQTSRADHEFECAHNLGFCAWKLKRHQEAADGFELAMQLARSNEEKGGCCAYKAAALALLGQFEDALSLVHQVDSYYCGRGSCVLGYSDTDKPAPEACVAPPPAQAFARNVERFCRQGMQKELAKSTAEALRKKNEEAEAAAAVARAVLDDPPFIVLTETKFIFREDEDVGCRPFGQMVRSLVGLYP